MPKLITMTFAEIVERIVVLINNFVGVIVMVAMIIFFIGLVRYIYRAPNPKAKKYGRDMIVWGLLTMFVMISIWGILRLAQESLSPVLKF